MATKSLHCPRASAVVDRRVWRAIPTFLLPFGMLWQRDRCGGEAQEAYALAQDTESITVSFDPVCAVCQVVGR